MTREIVTMRTFGTNGRFANQLFQYAFLRFYARQYDMDIELPPWCGNALFGVNNNNINKEFACVHVANRQELLASCAARPLGNVDFWGYFQDVEYFFEDKAFFRSLFLPVAELRSALVSAWKKASDCQVIGLHMRYGDYGYGPFYETPHKWVSYQLERTWETLQKPVLYLATDDVRAHRLFKKFNPMSSSDIFAKVECPDFYKDFWALSKANAMLICSNSSFSFAAAMLNEHSKLFLRPCLKKRSLIWFDPWASEVLIYHTSPLLNFLGKHLRLARLYNNIRRSIIFNLLSL